MNRKRKIILICGLILVIFGIIFQIINGNVNKSSNNKKTDDKTDNLNTDTENNVIKSLKKYKCEGKTIDNTTYTVSTSVNFQFEYEKITYGEMIQVYKFENLASYKTFNITANENFTPDEENRDEENLTITYTFWRYKSQSTDETVDEYVSMIEKDGYTCSIVE